MLISAEGAFNGSDTMDLLSVEVLRAVEIAIMEIVGIAVEILVMRMVVVAMTVVLMKVALLAPVSDGKHWRGLLAVTQYRQRARLCCVTLTAPC